MGKKLGVLLVVVLVIVGPLAFTVWAWHDLAKTGEWWPKMAFLMPMISVVSLCQLFVEGVPASLTAEFDTKGPKKTRWYLILAFGALVGAVNCYLMDRGFEARKLPAGSYRQY